MFVRKVTHIEKRNGVEYNTYKLVGRSKEGREDCVLVTLGLVLDKYGFPKKSEVFSGNVGEPGTLESTIKALSSNNSIFKPIVVLDRGIATEVIPIKALLIPQVEFTKSRTIRKGS